MTANCESLKKDEEIAAKDAIAPRVSLDDLTALIREESYFNLRDAIPISDRSGKSAVWFDACSLVTICVLITKSGFVVTGKSACASPENYDAEKGKIFARKDAIDQLWALEGYRLKSQLYVEQTAYLAARSNI